MKSLLVCILIAGGLQAQTYGAMSRPLPWRTRFAPVESAESTWTGSEQREIASLVAVLRGGFGELGQTRDWPEAQLQKDAFEILRKSQSSGLSSGQGREVAARYLWSWGCGIWKEVSRASGGSLDGEDLVAMANQLDASAAGRWGAAKREFQKAISYFQVKP